MEHTAPVPNGHQIAYAHLGEFTYVYCMTCGAIERVQLYGQTNISEVNVKPKGEKEK